MTQHPTNDAIYGPLLNPEDQEPGRWSFDDHGVNVWSGEMQWRTMIGDATICWLLGKPRWISNARLPDNTILPFIETASTVQPNIWRRPGKPRGYIHGAIQISQTRILFVDSARPKFIPKRIPGADQAPDLEADLGHDPQFLSLIQNDGVAFAAYYWLQNRDLRKEGFNNRWSATFSQIAGFIVAARQFSESRNDFFPHGGYFTDSDCAAFTAVVSRLGWHELTNAERSADGAAAISMLVKAERRISGPRPDWTLNFDKPTDKRHISRMQAAAIDGKISHREWVLFVNLYNFQAPVGQIKPAITRTVLS